MKTNLKLTAIFEPDEEGGYIAYIEEIPGVNSQGETLDEAKENILDALNLVMETRREIAAKDLKRNNTLKRKYIREDIVFA
ncbi:MAG: type II toxin-antitoxin system HicB family antitoxin [Bacteroidetes bacterium]|nr:type II toxin-antitoxin system HicB family antitoxin [Bacteroidota bacterium]